MTRYFSAVSVSALSAIAWVALITPAFANDKAYPELMLRSLVEMCVKEQPKGLLVPFAKEGASEKTSEKTLPTIMGEYQAIVTKSIEAAKQTRLEQEQAIDASIAQRLVQLKEKLKDPKALKQELTKVREVIAIGSVNGEKLTVEQLKSLAASANDLEQLAKDPKYVEVMAKAAKLKLLTEVRSRETQFKLEANKGLLKLQRCECTIERIQKRYSVNELGDRIKLEVTGSNGISTDVKEGFAQCPKP
jgi:hypothetical protein